MQIYSINSYIWLIFIILSFNKNLVILNKVTVCNSLKNLLVSSINDELKDCPEFEITFTNEFSEFSGSSATFCLWIACARNKAQPQG